MGGFPRRPLYPFGRRRHTGVGERVEIGHPVAQHPLRLAGFAILALPAPVRAAA